MDPITTSELGSWLSQSGATVFERKPDYEHSISSHLLKAKWSGCKTIAIGDTAEVSTIRVGAILDLISWELAQGGTHDVRLLLTSGIKSAQEAVRTTASIRQAQLGGPSVSVFCATRAPNGDIQLVEMSSDAPRFDQFHKAEDWKRMLDRSLTATVEGIALELALAVDHPSLRLYPMLTGSRTIPKWSFRIDGLEVAQVDAIRGSLDVGRTTKRKDGTDGISKPRKLWLEVAPGRVHVGAAKTKAQTPASVESAAKFIRDYIARLQQERAGDSALSHGLREHALESSVLRGTSRILVDEQPLALAFEDHPHVARGSQFPTRWSETGPARYLDALLKGGSDTPWAVELKVIEGGGAGSYYRHAITQAILYRHFIKEAKPLEDWFRALNLEPLKCRAAVAFPRLDKVAAQVKKHRATAELFDVKICEIEGWNAA